MDEAYFATVRDINAAATAQVQKEAQKSTELEKTRENIAHNVSNSMEGILMKKIEEMDRTMNDVTKTQFAMQKALENLKKDTSTPVKQLQDIMLNSPPKDRTQQTILKYSGTAAKKQMATPDTVSKKHYHPNNEPPARDRPGKTGDLTSARGYPPPIVTDYRKNGEQRGADRWIPSRRQGPPPPSN
jgi:hypothetical protein